MPSTHSYRPESSSNSLPRGSYSNNSDVTNSLNSTKILTVNNYFGSYPGQSSTNRGDYHQGFFPPSRSSLTSIADVSEDGSLGTNDSRGSGGIDDDGAETSPDASASIVRRRGVRFSEDAQPRKKQGERHMTYLAAYENDMDVPGGIDASDCSSFECMSQKSSFETVGPVSTKSPWTLVPVTVKNFNNSKTIPEKIRAYMRSDFFGSSRSIALWTPSPGLNHDPKITLKNIAVGDVGVFTVQGGFEVFFNIFMTEEVNKEYGYHPPPNFTPCAMITKGNIYKASLNDPNLVRGSFVEVPCEGYLFSCETPCTRLPLEGSALVLPMGGWKFSLKLATMRLLIQSYLNVHAESWYRYYKSPNSGPMLPNGSLKIVHTTYKTSTWALAVGAKDLTTQEGRLFANLSRPNQDEDIFRWKRHRDVSVDTGPSAVEMGGGKATLINQCVAVEVDAIKPAAFLRTLNATLTRISLYLSPK
ncbi:unnamed protein product [Cyclocybe aegerita]|uniref:Uncharacterized protein n=1 Tax=Cyclocybe aegerita TaxID=1973307 RepID=A0A8S0VUY8_CYCAE|nr:unnamed protein product [Cyclocybe aegerita]